MGSKNYLCRLCGRELEIEATFRPERKMCPRCGGYLHCCGIATSLPVTFPGAARNRRRRKFGTRKELSSAISFAWLTGKDSLGPEGIQAAQTRSSLNRFSERARARSSSRDKDERRGPHPRNPRSAGKGVSGIKVGPEFPRSAPASNGYHPVRPMHR